MSSLLGRLVRSSQGLSKGFVLKGLKLFQTPEELAQVGPGESDQHLFSICSSHKSPQLPHIG
jgi:hypothetical protein